MTSLRWPAVTFQACWCALAALASMSAPASAVDLAYSFESGTQGFGPNGPGITVTQDTIGATEGTHSLKVSIVAGATFVGAATSEIAPYIGDPPGLDYLLFDLTITQAFPSEGFVDAGVTVFGISQPDLPGGQLLADAQFQFNQVSLGDLEVGTHEIRIDLSNAIHPLTFEPDSSFNDIFGVEGSGITDVIPTGFQIYINKSSNAPWTGYFDNIRVGSIPGPNGGDYNGDGVVNAADYTVWRDNVGVGPAGDGTTTGDLDGVPDGVVDDFDYQYWAQQYGSVITPPTTATIPEPTTALSVVIATALGLLSAGRNRPLDA